MARWTPYSWNVAIMSAGWFFLFMAFNTAQQLETTVVADKQMVYVSLGTLYAVFTLSSIVAPKVVEYLGPRLCMIVGAIPYVLLVFANMKPTYYLFVPAFLAVGLGASILWTGQGIFISRCAIREAEQLHEPVEVVTSRMNSMFFTVFQFNAAVGLTIASIIYDKVDPTYMFLGFGFVGTFGIAIMFLVRPANPVSDDAKALANAAETGSLAQSESDPLTQNMGNADEAQYAEKKRKSVSLYDTLRLLAGSRAIQLLAPIIFYNGASLGFMGATFPLSYQDSADSQRFLDKSYVGYQAATFYIVNSAASFLWGVLVPRVGRRPLLWITLVTHVIFFSCLVALATNSVSLGHDSVQAFAAIFLLAAIFAVGDSVLESQLPAIIQSPTFFPEERDREAAVSNLRMWMSLGYTIQFVFGIAWPGNVLVQLWFVFPLMLVAMSSLFYLDRFVRPVDTKGVKGNGGGGGGAGATANDSTTPSPPYEGPEDAATVRTL